MTKPMSDDRIKQLIEAMALDPPWRNFFDPFTDANDDYAVLEWIRAQGIMGSKIATELSKAGCGKWSIDYQIGDYARAALKVIDD